MPSFLHDGQWVEVPEHVVSLIDRAAYARGRQEATEEWLQGSDAYARGRADERAENDAQYAQGYLMGRADERERNDAPIQGEHDPLCFSAIRDVRVGDWGPSCFTCEVIGIARQQATEAAAQRVEALIPDNPSGFGGMYAAAIEDALSALRALQKGAVDE